jgi:uncharacterized membrane protein YgdD (TMEM256/DUF423 family)
MGLSLAKCFIIVSAIAGALAVAMGAFAAHGLKSRLDPTSLATLRTAVDYQFYHALALLGVALLMLHWPTNGQLSLAGSLLILGVLLFCGSLYGLALLQWRWLGPVTPFGGLCFIAAWVSIAVAVIRQPG